jgi:hypothetical protein
MQSKKDINPVQFATIAANLLNQGLLESGRTTAKRMFRELEAGRTVTLTKLRMEDDGLTRIDLRLDKDAFQGTMNYSAFRDGVLSLIASLSDTLREKSSIGVLYPIVDGQSVTDDYDNLKMFDVGGLTVHGETPNVLMLGVLTSADQPLVTLNLMYVDPEQFKKDQSTS